MASTVCPNASESFPEKRANYGKPKKTVAGNLLAEATVD
jgi:hypothetical protein